jgi:hypothetical protein
MLRDRRCSKACDDRFGCQSKRKTHEETENLIRKLRLSDLTTGSLHSEKEASRRMKEFDQGQRSGSFALLERVKS